MTDFATGVQRWCSCLDCVLKTRTRSPPAFACWDFGRFASGPVRFRIRYGLNAVGLRLASRSASGQLI